MTHTPSFRPRNPEATRAAPITTKLVEGNTSAAVRILCSEDTPAECSIADLAKLQTKHTPEHADARPLLNSVDKPTLQVTEEVVLKSIHYSLQVPLEALMASDPNILGILCSQKSFADAFLRPSLPSSIPSSGVNATRTSSTSFSGSSPRHGQKVRWHSPNRGTLCLEAIGGKIRQRLRHRHPR